MEKPNLYIMIGVPGSGKSTRAHQILENEKNCVIHATDDIRDELTQKYNLEGGANNQSINAEVFELVYKRTKESLLNNVSVIYDATNISSIGREKLISNLRRDGAIFNAYYEYLDTPIKQCKERNEKRYEIQKDEKVKYPRLVPEKVIDNMSRLIEKPKLYEGYMASNEEALSLTEEGEEYDVDKYRCLLYKDDFYHALAFRLTINDLDFKYYKPYDESIFELIKNKRNEDDCRSVEYDIDKKEFFILNYNIKKDNGKVYVNNERVYMDAKYYETGELYNTKITKMNLPNEKEINILKYLNNNSKLFTQEIDKELEANKYLNLSLIMKTFRNKYMTMEKAPEAIKTIAYIDKLYIELDMKDFNTIYNQYLMSNMKYNELNRICKENGILINEVMNKENSR